MIKKTIITTIILSKKTYKDFYENTHPTFLTIIVMFSSLIAQNDFKGLPFEKLSHTTEKKPASDDQQPLQILVDAQGKYSAEHYRTTSAKQIKKAKDAAFYSTISFTSGVIVVLLAQKFKTGNIISWGCPESDL